MANRTGFTYQVWTAPMTSNGDPPGLTRAQWTVTLLIAAVQFVNILDFVIVMPLGPIFAKALSIDESHLGYVNGSYTAAASVTGLLGSFFLDRFDRRSALGVALFGLVLGTAAAALASDLRGILAARVIAGAFGGPATSLSFSIIADAIPEKMRGKAMGTVMGAFSVAAVLGVPAGLYLAETVGWRAPFLSVAGVGAVVALLAIAALPPMRGHLERRSAPVRIRDLLASPLVRLSYAMTATAMMAGFLVIPNIAAYVHLNLGLPEDRLKYAYGMGGVASFLATQAGGRLVDRLGSFRVGAVGAFALVVLVGFAFFVPRTAMPAWVVFAVFVGFMLANGLRNVSLNTLTTKVPAPEVRARFQSLQSAVQHAGSALAAWGSAQLLTTVDATFADPSREPRMLAGMPVVAGLSMALSLLIPVLMRQVEQRVRARQEPAPVPVRLRTAP